MCLFRVFIWVYVSASGSWRTTSAQLLRSCPSWWFWVSHWRSPIIWTSKPGDPPASNSPALGLSPHTVHHIRLFSWVLGTQMQYLMHVYQTPHQLSCLPNPNMRELFERCYSRSGSLYAYSPSTLWVEAGGSGLDFLASVGYLRPVSKRERAIILYTTKKNVAIKIYHPL